MNKKKYINIYSNLQLCGVLIWEPAEEVRERERERGSSVWGSWNRRIRTWKWRWGSEMTWGGGLTRHEREKKAHESRANVGRSLSPNRNGHEPQKLGVPLAGNPTWRPSLPTPLLSHLRHFSFTRFLHFPSFKLYLLNYNIFIMKWD